MPRRSKTAPENIELADTPTEAEDLGDAYVAAPERVKPDDESTYLTLPTLILPQTLLLPRMSLPYPLDDEEETQAVDDAIKHDRLILVLAARDQDLVGSREPVAIQPAVEGEQQGAEDQVVQQGFSQELSHAVAPTACTRSAR